MNLKRDKYIIVEIIPTRSTPDKGFIAQISALKVEGIKLLDRFDYRVTNRHIESPDIKNMIAYDKKAFTYLDETKSMLKRFREWSEGLPLLTIDNTYTPRYLASLKNHQEMVFPHLGLDFAEDVFDQIMAKYPIEPTQHLVDIIYEALIYEGYLPKKIRDPKKQ